MAGQWTFPDGVCEQHNIPNKSMRYWPKDIARADRKEQDPLSYRSAYPDFRRVGDNCDRRWRTGFVISARWYPTVLPGRATG